MKPIEIITPGTLPPAAGHYSYGIAHGGTLYVSGQLGRGPGMSDAQAGDIVAQTRRSLASLAEILRAGGSDLSRLLKVSAYITDVEQWPAVNAVYAEVLGKHRPARTVLAVASLHYGALIEIDAIAASSVDGAVSAR